MRISGRIATCLRASPAPACPKFFPIHGRANDAESIPVPPIMFMSSDPPRGNCSLVTPSMVGQKNVFPTPKTVAAANAIATDVPGWRLPSQYKPAALRIAQPSSMAGGEMACAIGPAKERKTNIKPAV